MPTPQGACLDPNSYFILVSSRDGVTSGKVCGASHGFNPGSEWVASCPWLTLNGPVTLFAFSPGCECLPPRPEALCGQPGCRWVRLLLTFIKVLSNIGHCVGLSAALWAGPHSRAPAGRLATTGGRSHTVHRTAVVSAIQMCG